LFAYTQPVGLQIQTVVTVWNSHSSTF